MFRLPKDVIATFDFEQFVFNGKGLNRSVEKKLKTLRKNYTYFSRAENNHTVKSKVLDLFTTRSDVLNVTNKQGTFLYESIQKQVKEDTFVYIETLGNELYFLSVKNDVVISEVIFTVIDSNGNLQIPSIIEIEGLIEQENKDHLNAPYFFFARGAEAVVKQRDLVTDKLREEDREAYSALDALYEEADKSPFLLNCAKINEYEHKLSFGVLGQTVVDVNLTSAFDTNPAITYLMLEELGIVNKPIRKKSTFTIYAELQAKKYERLSVAIVTLIIVFFTFSGAASELFKEKKIKKIEKKKAIEKVDSYKEYRSFIQSKGVSSEMALHQISDIIKRNDSNLFSIGWAMNSLHAKGVVFNSNVISIGGNNKTLRNYVATNNKELFFNGEKDIVIGETFQHFSIDSEVYLTPVHGELNYLNDAYFWLYTKGDIRLREKKENDYWSALTVDISFDCWLAEDFKYFGTQLYSRNINFVELKAKKGVVEGNNSANQSGVIKEEIDSCGYSGVLTLDLLGYNVFTQKDK